MILLTATTDALEVITSSTSALDVHVSWMDMTTADPPVVKGSTSGRLHTAIVTAVTTDICVAPAASTIRNVQTINIRNKGAADNIVTVQFNQNATLYELHKVTLKAGEALEYVEGVGWFVMAATAKLDKRLRVTSDYVNATTSFSDITGLTCAVESGKFYCFLTHLFHFANATTSGPRFAINGPAMTAMRLAAIITESGGVAAAVMNANVGDVTALETAVAATTDSTTAMVMSIMSGYFNPSAAGTFAIRGASEVAVAAGLTVKTGSWLHVWETDQ